MRAGRRSRRRQTTLWAAAIDAARELRYRVLETRPAQAEARLAFSGLGDLLAAELPELLEALPAPQSHALRVALLLEEPHGSPVAPLSLGAVHKLLQGRIGLVLSRPALRRLYDVAGGNAFYALELGRALERREATLGLRRAPRCRETFQRA